MMKMDLLDETRLRGMATIRMIGAITVVVVIAAGVVASVVRIFPAVVPIVAQLGNGADIPSQINHQGVVTVDGTRFNGNGLFRFAIVDTATGNNLWTNDGSNIPGPGQPTAAVTLTVTDGIYSVMLGDAGLTNMTAISAGVFDTTSAALRIWFDDGANGIQQLVPDQKLTSAPYCFRAATVSDGAVTSAKIADGSIVDADINTGAAIAWNKVNKSGAVPGDVGAAAASHGHSGADLTDGTVTSTKIADGTIINADISGSAAIVYSKLSGVAAASHAHAGEDITSGTIASARLDADLQDLADGSLTGSKVGSGISGTNVTSGTVAYARVDQSVSRARAKWGSTYDSSAGVKTYAEYKVHSGGGWVFDVIFTFPSGYFSQIPVVVATGNFGADGKVICTVYNESAAQCTVRLSRPAASDGDIPSGGVSIVAVGPGS